MALQWDEDKYNVAKIVKEITPPVGIRTNYMPGEDGFLEKDLTRPVGTVPTSRPIDLSTPGAEQRRLTQLENTYPSGGQGALPITSTGTPTTTGSQVSSNLPVAPKYQIPPDMMSYFDDAVKNLTGSNENIEHLKNMSQGFGLIGMSPRFAAQSRIGATKALADIEVMKKNAASNLAKTMSYLMTDPSKFNLDLFKKQMDYDIGRRAADVEERRAGVAEMKAPWEAHALSMASPKTTTGIGPSGENVTLGWNPDEKRWDTLTKGALPVGVKEGETLINPLTKETLGTGKEGTRFKEDLGKIAFRSYADEMKQIENDLSFIGEGGETKKREAQAGAYARLQEQMRRLGHGDIFEGESTTSVPKRNPNETIDEYLQRING